MIPNLYMKNGFFTISIHKQMDCLEFQVYIYVF